MPQERARHKGKNYAARQESRSIMMDCRSKAIAYGVSMPKRKEPPGVLFGDPLKRRRERREAQRQDRRWAKHLERRLNPTT